MIFLYKCFLCAFVGFYYIGVICMNVENNDYDDYYTIDNINSSSSSSNSSLQFLKELYNVSVKSGHSLKLRCDIRVVDDNVVLSKIKIVWLKNEASISEEEPHRLLIKTIRNEMKRLIITRLKISKLEVDDSGFYSCCVAISETKIKSQNYVIVSSEGTTEGHGGGGTTTNSVVYLESTTSFSFRDARTDASRLLSMIANYSVTEPFCQQYTGNTCKDFLYNKYVFVQPPFTLRNIEEKLTNAFLVISQSKDLSESCRDFALPSLCYSAFPLCVDDQLINMHDQPRFVAETKDLTLQQVERLYKTIRNRLPLRRICRNDCELLENELCRVEYAIAKRHPVIGQTLQLEECLTLPQSGDANAQYCLPLGIDKTQNVQKDDTCYWGNGETYRGIQNTSTNGSRCLKWAHQFQIPLSNHPELAGHAYCRNPDGVEDEPFCFTEQTQREVCHVNKCATYIWIYISVGFILCTILGITGILYLCCLNRNKQNPRRLQNMNTPTADKNIYGNSHMNSPMELNPMLPTPPGPATSRNNHQVNSSKHHFQNVPNYTHKDVTFVDELGEGAFGKVYKGELKMKKVKIFVAVKALKENASAKTQADFQREIDLISELNHPNIICLLGVIIKQEPMCMLFEFMSEGDLHEFLRANSPSEGKSLTQNEFLHIALQIALGMEYLSGNHYVHRDLAARNCLVSKDLTVKISDFGLSRDMYSCDYYRVQSKSLLPVRWMPPESILYGKFTTESDVWSYGVVLWEIYSYGLQPYYGYNNQEVINMIRNRKLLPCPDYCPSYCYSLMIECWAELAIRRPSFAEISHRLRVWKQNDAYYLKNNASFGHSSKSNDHQLLESWPKCSSYDLNESQTSLTTTNRIQSSTNNLNNTDSSLRHSKCNEKAARIKLSHNGDNIQTT